MANNALLIASVLLMSLSKVAWSYEMLIVGRFLVGVNGGRLNFYVKFDGSSLSSVLFVKRLKIGHIDFKESTKEGINGN